MRKTNQQIIIILAQNKPGVLSKVTSLCRRRRYNIKSLTAGTTNVPNISQMALVFTKEEKRLENIVNQMDKLIEVVSVKAVEAKDIIDRELVLLVVRNREVADRISKNNIHDINLRTINNVNGQPVLEVIGEGEEVEHILSKLDFKRDVVRMVRSGLVALKL